MREVILYMSMSLDGLVASDREHPGVAIADPEVKRWKLDRISKAGAHLMGRVSYQEMASYWPQSDDPYAAPMNDIPKVVFSSTLSDADATWPRDQGRPRRSRGRDCRHQSRTRSRRHRLGRCEVCRRARGGGSDRRVPPLGAAVGPGSRTRAVRSVAGVATPGPRRGDAVPQRDRRPGLPAAAQLRRGLPAAWSGAALPGRLPLRAASHGVDLFCAQGTSPATEVVTMRSEVLLGFAAPLAPSHHLRRRHAREEQERTYRSCPLLR